MAKNTNLIKVNSDINDIKRGAIKHGLIAMGASALIVVALTLTGLPMVISTALCPLIGVTIGFVGAKIENRRDKQRFLINKSK